MDGDGLALMRSRLPRDDEIIARRDFRLGEMPLLLHIDIGYRRATDGRLRPKRRYATRFYRHDKDIDERKELTDYYRQVFS